MTGSRHQMRVRPENLGGVTDHMLSSPLVLFGSTLVLCGLNMLLFFFFCRSERRYSVNGGGGTTFCGGRGQGWRLDQSAEEPGGGGIRPHLLHQSLPGQQCQRCHDLHLTFTWPSYDLHLTFIQPTSDLQMTFTRPTCDLHMTFIRPMSDLSFNSIQCYSQWPWYDFLIWLLSDLYTDVGLWLPDELDPSPPDDLCDLWTLNVDTCMCSACLCAEPYLLFFWKLHTSVTHLSTCRTGVPHLRPRLHGGMIDIRLSIREPPALIY